MPRDYFCVIQWDLHTPTDAAILDETTRFFRYFDEAEAYAMSCAHAHAAGNNLAPCEIHTMMHPTGIIITVESWTCAIRAFPGDT
jgi:hypothetical protein